MDLCAAAEMNLIVEAPGRFQVQTGAGTAKAAKAAKTAKGTLAYCLSQ